MKRTLMNGRKRLLVIGAGFLQDFVICKARAMGYETLAVDGNPEAVGFKHADRYKVIDIVDEKACLEYARAEKIDGVLTAATDYGVLTVAYIAREMGLPGLDIEVARLIKNKYRVRKCLYEHHVDDTEQAYEVDNATDFASLSAQIVFPVMVKPCDGSGSRGASRVDSADMLEYACRAAIECSRSQKALVETFIFGKEYGAESFVINGEVHVLGVIRKWMTEPPYYAELGHAIPNDLSAETELYVRECVTKAIKALGINFGSVNMDMLITADGKVHIIDIGARMGGNLIGSHIIPLGTGFDYIANMVRAAVGDEVDMKRGGARPVATRLLALRPGKVESLPNIELIEKNNGVTVVHRLNIGTEITQYRTNLDGCGYVVVQRDDVENAIAVADQVRRDVDDGIKRDGD